MNGATWSIPLGMLIAKAQGNLDLVARKIVFTAFSRVIMRTPVDTGAARGGWQCSSGVMGWFTRKLGLRGATGADPSGANAVAEAQDAVTNWHPLTGRAITMSNNRPYIKPLEDGHSKQAPNGMIKITMAEIGGIAQDAAAESQGGTFGGARSPLSMGGNWDIGAAGE